MRTEFQDKIHEGCMKRVRQKTAGNTDVDDYNYRFKMAELTLDEIADLSKEDVLEYTQRQCQKVVRDLA